MNFLTMCSASTSFVLIVVGMAGAQPGGAMLDCEPCCAPTCGSAQGAVRIREYHSDQELSTNPLGGPSAREVVYSVYLDDGPLREGEIVVALGELQLTHQGSGVGNPASQIYIGTSSSWSDDDDASYYEITEANGSNLSADPYIVRDLYTRVGTYQAPVSFPANRRYVNLVAYTHAGTVNVSAGDGKLSVIRITPVSSHSQCWTMTHSNSGDHGELVDCIPPDNVKTVVYSVQLPDDVKAGDIVVALGECFAQYTGASGSCGEVSGTFTKLHAQIRLGTSPTDTQGKGVTKSNGFDLTLEARSKFTVVKAGAYRATSDLGTRWANFIIWSDKGINDITDDQGRLAVLHFRPAIGVGATLPIGIKRYDTCNRSEQICTLPPSDVKKVLYTQPVCSLSAGETIVALSEMEATNEDSISKRLTSRLIVADSATGTSLACSSCEIAEASSVIIHEILHHGVAPKVGALTVTSDLPGTKYLNRVVYSAQGFDGNCSEGKSCDCCECPAFGNGERCSGDGACDVIELDYGRLSILRITPLAGPCTFVPADVNGDGYVDAGDVADVMVEVFEGACKLPCRADLDANGVVDYRDLVLLLRLIE
jgi:hypothetical protein